MPHRRNLGCIMRGIPQMVDGQTAAIGSMIELAQSRIDVIEKLRKDISVTRYSLIPEEKVSSEEMEEIPIIEKEMEMGRRFKLDDVLGEL